MGYEIEVFCRICEDQIELKHFEDWPYEIDDICEFCSEDLTKEDNDQYKIAKGF